MKAITSPINTSRYNWKPVVASLFQALADQGFVVKIVNNGDDDVKTDVKTKSMKEAIEKATASDEADVWLKHPSEASNLWLKIVLGNAASETVSDFGVRDTATGKLFEKTIEQWSSSMEGMDCPHDGMTAWHYLRMAQACLVAEGDIVPRHLADDVQAGM